LSIIIDIAENGNGERIYLFAFGYIPAQDIHILKPMPSQGIGIWFSLEGYEKYISRFGAGQYYRF